MVMRQVLALSIAVAVASNAFCATGKLTVFDDSDENGFNRPGAICTESASSETFVVHSGTTAVAVVKADTNGVGWVAPVTYSATSDYDGVSFWINAGNDGTTLTSLAVFDALGDGHFLHLEEMYGGPLPANTWVPFQIAFSSSFFDATSSSSPQTIQSICLINHTSGAGTDHFFVDDVALIGADIFLSGFEN